MDELMLLRESPILIIGSDLSELQILEGLLDSWSLEYLSCPSWEEFLGHRLQMPVPTMILLDIAPKRGYGFLPLEELTTMNLYKDVPVILLSSSTSHTIEVNAFSLGAAEFIRKPLNAGVLYHRIWRILRHSRDMQQLRNELNAKSLALSNEQRRLKMFADQTFAGFFNMIDMIGEYTKRHSSRVASYATAIGAKLELSTREMDDLYRAAMLHDIGKIGIPDAILRKPGPLTDDEYEVIMQHPTIGHSILKGITLFPEISQGARWHHERFDGRGYPDRLAGLRIPMIARIISVADAYDAMTNDRIYRRARAPLKARDEILKNSGTQFDPVIAKVAAELISNSGMSADLSERSTLPPVLQEDS